MTFTRRRFMLSAGLTATRKLPFFSLRATSLLGVKEETARAATQTAYYLDSAGSNQNDGKSPATPWKDFSRINQLTFQPGDAIRLRRGCVWRDELRIRGAGAPNRFFTIEAYGDGPRPKIQRNGAPSDRCIQLFNASYVYLSGLEVCSGGAGIILFYDHSYGNRSVYIDDVVAHDFQMVDDSRGGNRVTWSYGIGVTGVEDTPNDQTCVLSDFKVTNTEVYNTGAGIALDWGNHFCVDGTLALQNKFTDVYMENLYLHDNTVQGISFVSLFLTSVTRCTIKNSIIDRGTRFAATGTSALQILYSKDVSIINVTIKNTPLNPCPDNTGLDFECNNENPVIDGCTFENNAGPAIELLATPNNINPTTRNFTISNCTFVNNNWAKKLGVHQIEVANWQPGNEPSGKIYGCRYSNAPGTSFFGGDGNCTQVQLGQNINIGKQEVEPRSLRSWQFSAPGQLLGWTSGPSTAGISGLNVTGSSMSGSIPGPDPYLLSPSALSIPIGINTFVRIRMQNSSKGKFGQVYFITKADSAWNEAKHKDFWLHKEESGFQTYDVEFERIPSWTGVLEQLRVDPQQGASGGSFAIQSVGIFER